MKCRYYLLRLPHFAIMTDHEPLVPILNSYTLDDIDNPRLAPVDKPSPENVVLSEEACIHVRGVVANATIDVVLPAEYFMLDGISTATQEDAVYVKLTRGFPTTRDSLDPALLHYWKEPDNLYHDREFILLGPCILIPSSLRRDVLARLHDSHRGMEATKRCIRQTMWWPGISSDNTNVVRACTACQMLLPNQQQEPLMCEEVPYRPFECVSADFFSTESFLVHADRRSGWPVVALYGSNTASATIGSFRRFFRDLGVPLRLRTDGGPQFTCR
ncbi:uncharacterized protein K02A2.6-like [Scylla paramamosain]|uniref:uncharacterized protein K02A2.6-like n=1 Tax=Scylla paramamosain TaxID=85552 RepID=UPI00308350EC